MLSKEYKLELARLVDVKNQLDDEIAVWKKKASVFNADIKKLTGKDKIDWSELVRTLCEVEND